MFSLILVLFHVLGFLSSINAILNTRTAQGTIAWVISLNTLPMVTVPAYWVFGRNKFNGYVASWQGDTAASRQQIEHITDELSPYFVESPTAFPEYEAVKTLARFPFLSSNKLDLLIDGEATYQSIAEGMEQAEHYILFQFYILRDDEIGTQFQQQLIRKAKQGVAIYVLYDELGSRSLSDPWIDELLEAGVDILPFNTRQGRRNRFQLNFRNHRKIVVVDGKQAWLGGLNVGDDYLGKDRKLSPWRDTHMAIEGPAVLAAQATFFSDWHWASQAMVENLRWSPHVPADGQQNMLVLSSGPADKHETASLFFANLLNAARKRIWIATPYFIPDAATMTSLRLALLKGLEVKIIVPKNNDSWFVEQAAHTYLSELSGLGADVYFYDNGFMHQKVMLVDDGLSVVGTVNFDNRSFRLNFEVSGVVADQTFTQQLETMLLNDLSHSKPTTGDYLKDVSVWQRFISKACALLAPLL